MDTILSGAFLLVLHVLLWNLYIMFVYISSCACSIFMTIPSLVVELSPLELVNFTELLLSREIILQYWMLLVIYSSACAIFITILSLVAELSPLELVNFTKSLLSRTLLLHFCKYCSEIYTCLCVYEAVHMQFSCLSVHPSVCPWTQFCQELFSYSFAHTALKFIHNVCVIIKLCMCNFHDHTIIGCVIVFPWTCKFYWIIVQRNNPTVLHVLNSKFHTMLLVIYSSACAIFITILSLVAELSPLELVNFTKSLLSRTLLLHFCKYCSEIYTMFVCICLSVRPWTQFGPELPLLNHSPFCDQNLLYDNVLVGGGGVYDHVHW